MSVTPRRVRETVTSAVSRITSPTSSAPASTFASPSPAGGRSPSRGRLPVTRSAGCRRRRGRSSPVVRGSNEGTPGKPRRRRTPAPASSRSPSIAASVPIPADDTHATVPHAPSRLSIRLKPLTSPTTHATVSTSSTAPPADVFHPRPAEISARAAAISASTRQTGATGIQSSSVPSSQRRDGAREQYGVACRTRPPRSRR